jgi:hypothetical protein
MKTSALSILASAALLSLMTSCSKENYMVDPIGNETAELADRNLEAGTSDFELNTEKDSPQDQRITYAVVVHNENNMAPCDYLLKAQNGKILETRGLSREFKKDGLQVMIAFTPDRRPSICNESAPINIQRISLTRPDDSANDSGDLHALQGIDDGSAASVAEQRGDYDSQGFEEAVVVFKRGNASPCDYMLQLNDRTMLEAMNLDDRFKVDGAKVKIKYTVQRRPSHCEGSTPVKIESIKFQQASPPINNDNN